LFNFKGVLSVSPLILRRKIIMERNKRKAKVICFAAAVIVVAAISVLSGCKQAVRNDSGKVTNNGTFY